jgi:hypothetical protein
MAFAVGLGLCLTGSRVTPAGNEVVEGQFNPVVLVKHRGGPKFQAFGAQTFVWVTGQNYHADLPAASADPPKDLNPAAVRQCNVQGDRLRRGGLDAGQGFAHGSRLPDDLKPLHGSQHLMDLLPGLGRVFDDKYLHADRCVNASTLKVATGYARAAMLKIL